MNRPYVFGLLLALSAVSSVPRATAAETPRVILSEIAWAGSAQSTADEWIELANLSTESVPLGGWQLTGIGTGGAALTIPAETLLSAGSTYLISNYALADPKSTLNVPSDFVTTVVSIPNTALNIALIDHTGATIDSLVDPGTPNAGSSVSFASMERDPADLSWASAETSTNLLNDQLGSPGIVGHTLATPTEIAVIEEMLTGNEAPLVTEPVTDPEPTAPEVPAVETNEPVIDTSTTNEPVDVAIVDPVAVIPIDTVATIETPPLAPVVAPETTELEVVPATIVEIPAEIPVTIEESSIETVAVVEIAPSEEAVEVIVEHNSVETIEPETSDTPAIVEPEAPAPVATVHSGDVVISGVYPSPNTGDDEWAALTNTTDAAIDLVGITLVDASGAVTTLGDTIGAHTTIYVLNPKGKLNNDGDSISLVDSAGTVISAAAYGTDEFPAPKKGTVLSFSSALIGTEPIETPESQLYEETNIVLADTADPTAATVTAPADLTAHSSGTRKTRTSPVATTSTSIPTAHSTPNIATRVTNTSTTPKKTSTRASSVRAASAAPRHVSIDDIGSLADDTAITLEGIVVSTPGTIGKRSFFIDGLEIYQSQGDLAVVAIGDHVRVAGTLSVLSDHRRVNIKAGGVTVLGTSAPIVHEYTDSLQYGSLVHVTGTVSARDGNAVVLRIDDAHSVTIAPAAGITVNWADLAGKTITVSGILKNSSTPATVVLRNAEDIIVTQETIETAVAGTSSSSTIPWIGTGAAALAVTGFGAWIWRNRPRSSLTTLTLHPTSV